MRLRRRKKDEDEAYWMTKTRMEERGRGGREGTGGRKEEEKVENRGGIIVDLRVT